MDGVAKCRHRFSDIVVGLCQIEETSRVYGMSRAFDGEAAPSGDRYFFRAVDHHCMRRRQGESGFVQFHCRLENLFLTTHLDHKTCLQYYSQINPFAKACHISLRKA